MNTGVAYAITVVQHGKTTLLATLDPSCSLVMLDSNSATAGWRDFDAYFWTRLEHALGLPEATLYPIVLPAPDPQLPVEALHAVRRSYDANGQHAPFDRRVTDAARVRALYQVLLALPLMPRDIFCPLGTPIGYELTFSHAGTAQFLAYVSLDGCAGAAFGDGHLHTTLNSPTFWSQLATTLDVPESEVYQNP